MSSPLKIAIAGLGTVGGGTVQLLHDQADLLAARAGRRLELVGAAALVKPEGLPLDGVPFFTDARVMAAQAEYDVLVELIGGAGGIALDVARTALGRGRSVVTANKAMIAHHGVELASLAEASGGALGFEASVGGGIPIIKSLREGLAGNRVSKVMGILNGTCNYILTTMRSQGRDFGDVLAEAQTLGYAEADPSFDIDGVDTAHKLAILAALAFSMPVDIAGVTCEGIRHVSALDIRYADELGYRIKLLGVASLGEDGGVDARVYPAMVPLSFPLAHVDGVFNAIVTEGDFVGRTVLEGRGAGARPTASAVVSDLMDLARGHTLPAFGVPAERLTARPVSATPRHSAYYIRLMVRDEPGVFADIAAALRDERVSMEQIIQRGRSPSEVVPVVMTVHDTSEAHMLRAVERIAALPAVDQPPRLIRIESL